MLVISSEPCTVELIARWPSSKLVHVWHVGGLLVASLPASGAPAKAHDSCAGMRLVSRLLWRMVHGPGFHARRTQPSPGRGARARSFDPNPCPIEGIPLRWGCFALRCNAVMLYEMFMLPAPLRWAGRSVFAAWGGPHSGALRVVAPPAMGRGWARSIPHGEARVGCVGLDRAQSGRFMQCRSVGSRAG